MNRADRCWCRSRRRTPRHCSRRRWWRAGTRRPRTPLPRHSSHSHCSCARRPHPPHFFNQYQSEGKVRLFEGCDGYGNGEQRRDFVFIDDVVKVNLHFLDNRVSGIFNVGTGRAQSFNDVAVATVNACRAAQGEAPLPLADLRNRGVIEYIAFPEALKGKYQSYTEADISQLRQAGYAAPFATVEEGVAQYASSRIGS